MNLHLKEWHILWYFFRNFRMRSAVVLVLMTLSGFMEMLNLAALYPVINYGLNLNEEGNIVLDWFDKMAQFIITDNPFFAACVELIIVSILAVVTKFAYHYCSNRLLVKISEFNQMRIFNRLKSANFDFYVKNKQGRLIYAGSEAAKRTNETVLTTITLMHGLISSLFLLTLLVALSWKGTLLILGVAVIYAAVVKKVLSKIMKNCSRIYVEEKQNKIVILNELISGIKAIKTFLAYRGWEARYSKTVERSLNNQFRMMMGKVFPELFVKFLFFIAIALAGMFLSSKPHAEILSLLPVFATFAVVVNRFLPFAHIIGKAVMSIVEGLPDTKIVHDISTLEFPEENTGIKELKGFNERIKFKQVSFKYNGMDTHLLNDVSFTIEKKNMTALVGFSGAGKTTIINLLLKLYRPNKGSITIDGVNIFDLTNESYLSKVGYVSQETFVFNNSIKENIAFGFDGYTDEDIQKAAKLANAHEFILETPKGYDTIVGDSGMKLSGGQRQRIAIARAMLRKPDLLVLDEATSSLDNISEKRIQAAINDIAKHTTVLVIAHRLSTVQMADKIIILEKGKVIEEGTHQELLKNKKVYYDLYKSQETQGSEIIDQIQIEGVST